MRVRLGNPPYAVLEGPLALDNGGPQHGGKVGMERGQIAHDPFLPEMLKVGHFACVHERVDHFPVRAVPPDRKTLSGFRAILRHGYV